MAVELATAYVSIVPSTRGIAAKLKQDVGDPLQQIGNQSGKEAGRNFASQLAVNAHQQLDQLGGRIVSGLGTAFKVGAGAIAAGVATSVGLGLRRLVGIEEAQAKLRGLGHDAQAVDQIMTNALDSVRGTAFGLADAATIAAMAVAAGVEPGEELARELKLTADAATIAGVNLDQMGAILGKSAGDARVTMGQLNQLRDSGLGALQMLADHFGVTASEMEQMVASGQVSGEILREVLEEKIGGAALRSGETTLGAFKNMGAAAGRLGARLAGPVFTRARTFFLGVTGWIDDLEAGAGKLVEPFDRFLSNFTLGWEIASGAVSATSDTVDQLAEQVTRASGPAFSAGERLYGIFDQVRSAIAGIRDGWDGFAQTVGDGAALAGGVFDGQVLDDATSKWRDLGGALRSVTDWLVENADGIGRVVKALATAAGIVGGIAVAISGVGSLLAGASAALPLASIMGFVTALTYAWQNSETLRDTVADAFQIIRDAFAPISDRIIPGLQDLWTAFQEGDGVIDGLAKAWAAATADGGIFTMLVDAGRQAFEGLAAWVQAGGVETLLTAFMDGRKRMFDTALTIFSTLVEAASWVLPQLIGWIVSDAIPGLIDTIVAAIPLLLEAAILLFESLITAVTETLPVLVDTLLGEVLPNLVETVLGMLPDLLQAGIDLFLSLVTAVVEVLPEILNTLVTVVLPALVTSVLGMLPDILTAGMLLWLEIQTAVLKILPDIIRTLTSDLLPTVLNTVTGMMPDLLEAGTELFLELTQAIVDALPDIIDTLFVKLLPAIIEALLLMQPTLMLAAVELFIALAEGLVESLPELQDTFAERVAPAIAEAVIAMGPVLWESGKEIVRALISGIGSMREEIGKSISRVVGRVRDYLPFSPAKRGPLSGRGYPLYAGRTIARDLARGMLDGTRLVDVAAGRLAYAAQLEVAPVLAGLTGGAGITGLGAGVQVVGVDDRPIDLTVDLGGGIVQRYRDLRTSEMRQSRVLQGAR